MEQKSISELTNLSGKVAIVTGAAMGIGAAIASRLAEAGASVLVADMNKEKAESTANELIARGYSVVAATTDVSDEGQVELVVARAKELFGGVNILVNNAGIYPMKPVLDATEEDFERILKVNLKGAFLMARAAAKQMISQGKGGKIINITSIDALHPSSVGLAFYDASKHGLWGFTKNLALELAPHDITVNAIAPGGVKTPGAGWEEPDDPNMNEATKTFLAKIPMRRLAEADEIGKVALFLASDLSSYMTGSQIVVDGGTLLS